MLKADEARRLRFDIFLEADRERPAPSFRESSFAPALSSAFPERTEADFADAVATLWQAARIDWLGVFSYSDEEGAARFRLSPTNLKVPKRTIEVRRRKLMKLQQKISAESEVQSGSAARVDLLVEGPSQKKPISSGKAVRLFHAPEIDGKVFINDFGPHEALVPGTFYRAEITESHDYDVVARILE